MERLRIKAVEDELADIQSRSVLIAKQAILSKADIIKKQQLLEAEKRFRELRLAKLRLIQLKETQSAWRRQEDHLRRRLRDTEGILHVESREVDDTDVFGSVRSRTLKVAWQHTPRLLRIQVDYLRALKNKADKGRYVMMATIYDRIGGRPLRWSKLKLGGSFPSCLFSSSLAL